MKCCLRLTALEFQGFGNLHFKCAPLSIWCSVSLTTTELKKLKEPLSYKWPMNAIHFKYSFHGQILLFFSPTSKGSLYYTLITYKCMEVLTDYDIIVEFSMAMTIYGSSMIRRLYLGFFLGLNEKSLPYSSDSLFSNKF